MPEIPWNTGPDNSTPEGLEWADKIHKSFEDPRSRSTISRKVDPLDLALMADDYRDHKKSLKKMCAPCTHFTDNFLGLSNNKNSHA